MSILKVLRERAEPLNAAELAKLLRPFLHPAPRNSDDLRWEDLAELAPKELQKKPKDGAQ
jgi:hypothetical protein